jgi:hypothetical protein
VVRGGIDVPFAVDCFGRTFLIHSLHLQRQNMKTKLIAASVLALCSTAAFAAKGDITTGSVTCPTAETTAQNALATVNACAPDAVVYVAGSSALGAGIERSITALFTGPVIKVLDGSAEGFSRGVDVAFYGMRDGARLLVVYNPQNGSAAGVSQIFATPKTVVPSKGDSANKAVNLPESRVVHLKAPKREAAFADQARLRQQGSQFWPGIFCNGSCQGRSDLCTLGMNKPDSSRA